MTRPDGLTDAEGVVMDAACLVANGWGKLPVQHPSDAQDICDAVHRIQDLLAVRVARRAFPLGWPDKGGDA